MAVRGGFGVVLSVDVGTVLTVLAKVVDTPYPEFEKILAEVTSHDSPGGYYESVATGKRKLNEFVCKLTWDISLPTHAAILTAFESDAAVSWSIADPDGAETISFTAHVRTMNKSSDQEDAFFCEVAVEPTGEPTIV